MRWYDCDTICAAGVATLGGECDGTTGGTSTYTTDTANATVVEPTGRAAADDATPADANDGTSATNAAGDVTNDDAHATGTHDGTPKAVWRARPVRTGLLTRRGGLY